MIQEAGTKSLHTYIDRSQKTVAKWGALRPIFEVCTKEIGYMGGGGGSGSRGVDRWKLNNSRRTH